MLSQPELLFLICKKIPPKELATVVPLINKDFYTASSDEVLWKRLSRSVNTSLLKSCELDISLKDCAIRPQFWNRFSIYLLASNKQIAERKASLENRRNFSPNKATAQFYQSQINELDKINDFLKTTKRPLESAETIQSVMHCIFGGPAELTSYSNNSITRSQENEAESYTIRYQATTWKGQTTKESFIFKQTQNGGKEWVLSGSLIPFPDYMKKELTVTNDKGEVQNWEIIEKLYALIQEKKLSIPTNRQYKECTL